MAYKSDEKWAVPDSIAYPLRHQITRARKRADGEYEGLSAVYLGGKLIAKAATLAPSRRAAERIAKRMAKELEP